VPALIVHGEEDISIEMEEAEVTTEAIPDERLETNPNAGHSSNLENPAATNAVL
jgi:pimeloyl-ACP methyl ester carboxylesterase